MDEERKRAYRIVLAAGLLHVRWDLAPWLNGVSLLNAIRQVRAAHCASIRAYAFHNLAEFAARDFDRFDEDRFWRDIESFRCEFPDALCPYRDLFDRCLRGEPVNLNAPSGIERQIASSP